MSGSDVAVIALLVILAAVIWRKDVKAAFTFLGLGSFSLEAKDSKRYVPRERKPAQRSLPESPAK
jgi:hypothetical protein